MGITHAQKDKASIDKEGFRPNVGIIITNPSHQVLWARRIGHQDAWQFPQGGISEGEPLEAAMYRELQEETGLLPEHVRILGQTRDWLKYYLPEKFLRLNSSPLCIGQKQKWFLLELVADENHINLEASSSPEFSDWRWVSYWYPVNRVVDFKRNVYRAAMAELARHLPSAGQASP